MKNRIDSGASVSGQQLAMFGLSRNEQGQIVNGDGELHRGFGPDAGAAQPAPPDARLDAREKRAGAMNGPSIQPVRKIGGIGATSFTDTKRMNGPSIGPARPIGAVDTADGSGGSTLRRKKKETA